MIKAESKKIISWKTILVFLFLGVACYFSFLFLKIEAMSLPETAQNIEIYLAGYIIVPFFFVSDALLVGALITDLLYLSMCLFLATIIIHYYLEESVTTTIPRIGRKTWVLHMFLAFLIYCFIALGIYLLSQYFYSGLFLENISFTSLILPIGIKYFLGYSVMCTFFYIIIRYKNILMAILGSLGMHITISLLLRISIQENGFLYGNSVLLFLFLALFLVLMMILAIGEILRKDL